jgi:hypothetical protein
MVFELVRDEVDRQVSKHTLPFSHRVEWCLCVVYVHYCRRRWLLLVRGEEEVGGRERRDKLRAAAFLYNLILISKTSLLVIIKGYLLYTLFAAWLDPFARRRHRGDGDQRKPSFVIFFSL